MRLHMVGENGEAYRIAFEKHPSDPPEALGVTRRPTPGCWSSRRARPRGCSSRTWCSSARPRRRVAPVRLVELKRGGFGYVVLHATAKPSLMGLQGSELIAIDVDGKAIFPFFDAAELDRIALDTFRREPDDEGPPAPTPAPALLREERFSEAYEHKEVDTTAASRAGSARCWTRWRAPARA